MNESVVLHDAKNRCWVHFHSPKKIIKADKTQDIIPALEQVEELTQAQGLYAAGFIAYEASIAFDPSFETKISDALPPVWFGIYEKPCLIELPAADEFTVSDSLKWQPGITREEYTKAIHKIKAYLLQGDTYQVNYTYQMKSGFKGDPWALFVQMSYAQNALYSCFIDTEEFSICSASPELFFFLDKETLYSRPMKGTTGRGLWAQDDREKSQGLYSSEKNRAENLMIVDMVRNDMGRIAKSGTVKVPSLFTIEKYPTLWQMTSTVCASTDASLKDIFGALFPPSSITGAPKTRTMSIINELETAGRGLYTGCIGFISPERQAQFNVAIRTAVVDKEKKQAIYGVGGGIVWDSDESLEYEETLTKALVLKPLAGDFSILESILFSPEQGYFLLKEHLERMESSAAYFDYPFDKEKILKELDSIKQTLKPGAYKVRLVLAKDGHVSVNAEPLKNLARNRPAVICLARQPIDKSDIFLYHKTTNRQVYSKAISACPTYDDVLLWNKDNEITESTIANVIVEMDGLLFTPPVQCGLLEGIYRSWLIKKGYVREKVIKIDDLTKCSRICLINSVRKIMDVSLDFHFI